MLNQPEEFWATFEGADESDTRTYLDEQTRMRWTADDRLTIFTKTTYNREYAFTGKTGANAGGFKQVSVDDDFWFGYDVDYNYAIYPHSAANEFDETDCFFTTTMPAEQTYVENSFGLGANTMVAVSESGQLLFKNVGSYLRVMLWGENQTVKKITLSSIAGEALAGEAKIFATLTDVPTCTMVGTSSSIVLNCTDAVEVNTTEAAPVAFWIVLPPVVLAEGYKVVVENVDGDTQEFAINKEKTFKRNVYNTLKRELAIPAQPHTPALNEIWYTSTTGEAVTPNNATVFGSTLLTNTYSNGRGVMTFEGNVTKAGTKAFMDCSTLATIHLPEKATIVSSQAFQGCDNLTGVILPEKLAVLSSAAFRECTALKEITIPNVTSISAQAFLGCTSLEKVTLSPKTKSLGNHAFYQCTALKEIALPATVTSIGTHVFYQCKSLEALALPAAVSTIGERAFYQCTALKHLNLPTSLVTLGGYAFYECAALIDAIVPSGVTEIANRTFYGCKMLQRVELPEGLLSIGEGAFGNGSMLDKRNTSLTEVVIPSTVKSIADAAFGYCNALKAITLKPTTPPNFGDGVFGGCSSERTFYVPMASVTDYKVALGLSSDGQYVQGVEGL